MKWFLVLQSTEEAIKLADQIGYPVMIKVCLTSGRNKGVNAIALCFFLSNILELLNANKFYLEA